MLTNDNVGVIDLEEKIGGCINFRREGNKEGSLIVEEFNVLKVASVAHLNHEKKNVEFGCINSAELEDNMQNESNHKRRPWWW